MLTFRDTGKVLDLKGELLKMITKNKNNVDLASLSDKKLMYDFAKEIYVDVKAMGNKSIRDRSVKKYLNHQV